MQKNPAIKILEDEINRRVFGGLILANLLLLVSFVVLFFGISSHSLPIVFMAIIMALGGMFAIYKARAKPNVEVLARRTLSVFKKAGLLEGREDNYRSFMGFCTLLKSSDIRGDVVFNCIRNDEGFRQFSLTRFSEREVVRELTDLREKLNGRAFLVSRGWQYAISATPEDTLILRTWNGETLSYPDFAALIASKDVVGYPDLGAGSSWTLYIVEK